MQQALFSHIDLFFLFLKGKKKPLAVTPHPPTRPKKERERKKRAVSIPSPRDPLSLGWAFQPKERRFPLSVCVRKRKRIKKKGKKALALLLSVSAHSEINVIISFCGVLCRHGTEDRGYGNAVVERRRQRSSWRKRRSRSVAQGGHYRRPHRRRMHPRPPRFAGHPDAETRQGEQQRSGQHLHSAVEQPQRFPDPQRLGKEPTDPAPAGLPPRSAAMEGSPAHDPATAAATARAAATATTRRSASPDGGAAPARSAQHCLLTNRAKNHSAQADVEQELHSGQKSSPSSSRLMIWRRQELARVGH